MECFKFRQNTVLPEKQYMNPVDFFNSYYTSCDMKDIKNTAFMRIEGVGTFENYKFIYNDTNSSVIENLTYNPIENKSKPLITTVKNIISAYKDLKALKAFEKNADFSMGIELSFIEDASEATRIKIVEIANRIIKLVDMPNIFNICIICCSHGSLIIHFTLLYLAMICEPTHFNIIKQKLKIITHGSPRYLPKNLFNIYPSRLLSSEKKTLSSINSCSKINNLPSIINCYHVDDTVIRRLSIIKLKQFHFPKLEVIKSEFGINEHFKYDNNNHILYTNNINCVYKKGKEKYINSVSKEPQKYTDVFIRDLSVESVEPDILKPHPKELFPYHRQVNKKPFVHVDPGILYPLFKNNIILNLLYAPLRDSNNDGIINTNFYYKYNPTGYNLDEDFIYKGGRKRNTVKSVKSTKSAKS